MINQKHLDLIVERFFKGNPVSYSRIDFEGQHIDENGNYLLGCRAGPDVNVSNLIHEMSHLAEREIPKLLEKPESSWGFSFGKYWEVLGQSGYEPNTDQSIRREMRVWAYQWSICQALNIPVDEEENSTIALARVSVYIDAFYIYENNVLSESEREQLGYRESEKKAIQIMADEILTLSQNDYNYDNFCHNWNKRMEILR